MKARFHLASALCGATVLVANSAHSTTYEVGPGKPYPTIASLPQLAAGDIVEIYPGTYNEVKRWTVSGTSTNPITIRGLGSPRPIIDANGLVVDGSLPNPRAVFQIEGGNFVVENLEFKNARNGDNGSGVRVTGSSANNVLIRNCLIDFNDMGIMSDSNDNLLIESTEIANNGTSSFSGFSHNLYLGGQKTTLRFCYIHDSLYGQNVKSRGHYTELLYNYIVDSQDGDVCLVDAAETAQANSNAVMIGNVVISKPRLANFNHVRFIQFGQDGGGAHNGVLYAINNTFIAGDSRIQFLDANATGASIVATNNIFFNSNALTTGNGPVAGTNNWAPATATVPSGMTGTITGTNPGVLDVVSRDLHLMMSSPCRDAGLNNPTYNDGNGASQSGVPMLEYVNHQQSVARPSDGHLDIGAYEYGTMAPMPDGGNPGGSGGAGGGSGGTGGGNGSVDSGGGCGCVVGANHQAPSTFWVGLALVCLAFFARRRRS